MLRFFRKKKLPHTPQETVRFFNTLTGEKEVFTPIRAGEVRMYHCGPTVYDYAHIGNLRPYILADLLRRLFEARNCRVTQVINITDVGHLVGDGDEGMDKIEAGAEREQKTVQEIVTHYTNQFYTDLGALNIKTADTLFPRASEHIPEQITLLKTLEEKGYTYKTSDGIYFDTARFPEYGKLGHIDLAGLQEAARVEKNPEKRNPTDFALWKFSPKGSESEKKRAQEWDSPWGVGFPGWHLECSAMAMKYLGKTFDIHTGGIDHIPTHHNNEIAQSEAATRRPYARYWLHSEFITIDGTKISKSLGNVITLQHITEQEMSPLAYRYWLLSGHYRTQMNFTWEALKGAQNALVKLYRYATELPATGGAILPEYQSRFLAHLHNDLDTPGAIAVMWEMARDKDRALADVRATLEYADALLGLQIFPTEETSLQKIASPIPIEALPPEVAALVAQREEARATKEWSRADTLRDEIAQHGFTISDTPQGSVLFKKENA